MPLPEGYILRHPKPDEAAAVQAVLDAAESADSGELRHHENDIATDWRDPKCHLAEDWWVVAAHDGTVVAATWVWPQPAGEVTADHYVHPDHRGRGLGEALLDAVEARTAELPPRTPIGDVRHLVVWCEDSDLVRRASLENRGFAAVRQYFEMAIDLAAGLQPPAWPPGIIARGFRAGTDDHAVHEASEEAFVEHHLYEPMEYDEWRLFHADACDADITVWWLAWDGDELAGFIIPIMSDLGAVIGDLAVRKPWRGRGVAHSLLLAAFATLRDRGQTVVRLYVDAQNVTKAVRVYEAAGMHVARRFDVMQKPLG
jgi:mycothiol synthase